LEEDDALTKYLFAKYFGWTPKQVEKMSYRDVLIFKKLIEVEAKEKEYMMSKMEKEVEAKKKEYMMSKMEKKGFWL